MKSSINMLQGSIWNKLILFALPLAATSILQQLFNSADVAVVGQFAGNQALAAVGVNGPVINIMIMMFVGISIGVNVCLANLIGAKDMEKANLTVHTAITISLILGVVLAVAGNLLAVPLLKLLNTQEDILDLAALYLRIYFAGMPFIMLYNFENAIFRSKGNTKLPLLVLIAAGVINVGMNLFFVAVCGMNVEGVALATVISNAVSAVVLLLSLMKDDESTRFSFHRMKINGPVLKRIIRIGFPAGIQSTVFSLSNMFVMAAMNSLGSDAVAANTVSTYLDIFVYFLVDAFAQAATSFVGQNYGAGQLDRCRRITRISVGLGILFGAALAGIFLLLPRFFLGLYSSDPLIVEMATQRAYIVVPFAVFNVIYGTESGALRAYGYSTIPAVITVFCVCGIRIIWIYTIFAQVRTFEMLFWAYPISWMSCNLFLTIAYLILIKKVKSPEKSA